MIFFFSGKISLECGNALCMARNAQEDTKSLYARRCLPMTRSQENHSRPRGVGVLGCGCERKFERFKGTKESSQMSVLQTRRYTRHDKGGLHRLLTFTLSCKTTTTRPRVVREASIPKPMPGWTDHVHLGRKRGTTSA